MPVQPHSQAAPSSEGPRLPLRRGRPIVALLLLGIALVTRLVGIDQGLPHHGEPDAYIVKQAESMIHGGITDREFAGWKYPHLVGTVLALCAPEPVERLSAGAPLEDHLELATRLRERGRVVVAVMASVAAPATYLIAARFLAGRFAFLAGLLVATSLLHICFSVQARPHAPVSSFTALAILASIRWREKPTLGRAALLGLCVAASISTLHSGAAALAPMAAAFLGLLRSTAPKAKIVLGALLALTIVSVSAGWFYIRAEDGYGLDPTRKAGAIAQRQGGLGDAELDKIAATGRSEETHFLEEHWIKFSGHVISLTRFNGAGFAVALRTLSDYDPLILFFAALGLLGMGALALRRRRSPTAPPNSDSDGGAQERSAVWITLAYGVPTFLVYGVYQLSTDRFYLALLPVTCLLAAFGMSWLSARSLPKAVTSSAIYLSAAAMCAAAILVMRLRVAPDTFELAAQAVQQLAGAQDGPETAPQQDPLIYTVEIVGLPLMAKPESFARDAIWARGPWDTYQWALLHPGTRPVSGESREADRSDAAAPEEAARRLGLKIEPASTATRLRVFHAEDKAAAAQEALAEADPDIAIICTSKAMGHHPLGPTALRDAWKAAARADGRWQLDRTIKNSFLQDAGHMGYTLRFLGAFTSQARGPEIEVWTRR